jgi:hypothetical protein
LKIYGNDAVLKYYQSLSLILQGILLSLEVLESLNNVLKNQILLKKKERIHEVVRDLEFLKSRDDVGVGTLLALIHTHKKFSTIGLYYVHQD